MNRFKTNALLQTLMFVFTCGLLLSCLATRIEAKIVFCVDDDLYVMNDDGTHRRRLTKNTQAQDRHPRWSPDGTKIAFVRAMDKNKLQTSAEVFIINADGTQPQRLTLNNSHDLDPSWSPDGQRLAFTSSRSGKWDVFIIEVATLAVTQLTGINEDEVGSTAPDWSPDGTMLTFERFIRIKNGINPKTIYVMSADGQRPRPILPDPDRNDPPTFRFFPRWSADGQRILSYEVKWLGEQDKRRFFVQPLSGARKDITDINDRLGNNFLIAGASWMAHDRAIVFSLMLKDKSTPNYDIYRYGFETRSLKRLTRESADESFPDWTEGALSVSPHQKLPTQWGDIKQPAHAD